MSKELKINKQNELIRGYDFLSLNGKKCLNSIYYLLQKNYPQYPELLKSNYINIRLNNLRDIMNLSTNYDYIERIKEGMEELQTQIVKLKNFKNPLDNKIYDYYSFTFLDNVGFRKTDKEWIITIKLNDITKYLITKNENYTRLELLHNLNTLRTKYSMKLYEYLMSFKSYRYIDISKDYLILLLNLNPKSKYRYFSQLKELLERQIKEITNKTDFKELKLLPYKDKNSFRFIINPKSKKTITQEKINKSIKEFIKKF